MGEQQADERRPDIAGFERESTGEGAGAGADEPVAREPENEPAVPGRAPEDTGAGPFHQQDEARPPINQDSPSEGVSESNPVTGL